MIFRNWHPTLPMCATHRYPTNLPALDAREIVYLMCVQLLSLSCLRWAHDGSAKFRDMKVQGWHY